ncbi:MAG: hypothetical protein ABIJ12_09870 [bacterium]
MNWIEILHIWIMAFVTLALLSFLYKDNPIYKLVEHIFAGLSAGYYVGLIWDTVIVQQLYIPMFNNGKYWLIIPGILGFLMFTRFFPKFSWVSRISLAFFMGTAAGIFLVSQLHGLVLPQMQDTMTPRINREVVSLDGYFIHLGELEIVDPNAIDSLPDTTVTINKSEYTVAYGDSVIISSSLKDTTGASADNLVVSLKIRQQAIAKEAQLLERGTSETEGLTITDNGSGSFTTQYIFKPDTSYAAGVYDLSYEVKKETIMYPLTIIILIGVISTLIYFYFSKEHTGVLGVTAKVGIWFIMISFGAHFGYTVMGRVSLLIGRVQFLVEDWLGTFSHLF